MRPLPSLRPTAMWSLVLLAASAVLLAAACASRSRSALLLSDWEPPPGQSCRILDDAPGVDELVDSAAFREAVSRAGHTYEGRYALVALLTPRDGPWERVEIVEGDLPPMEQRRILDLLRPHLRRPEEKRWGRLRIRTGPPLTMEAGSADLCTPMLLSQEIMRRRLGNLAQALQLDSDSHVVLRLRVDTLGRVVDTEEVQWSGSRRFSEEARLLARELRFLPALYNRLKTRMWIQMPFRVLAHNRDSR